MSGVWRPERDSLKGQGAEASNSVDSTSKPKAKGFRWMRGRTAWNVWRMLHSCVGGLSMLMAVCQVFLGLALSHAAPWMWATWGSWLALLLTATLLLSLDSLPLSSSSSTGGSQGIVRWGRGRAQYANGEQALSESPAQPGVHNDDGSDTGGQENEMSAKGRGSLMFWPHSRKGIQGNEESHDEGLSRSTSAAAAPEGSTSTWAAVGIKMGGWRDAWQQRRAKAKEALAAQAEPPVDSHPEAAAAVGDPDSSTQDEAAAHEAVQVGGANFSGAPSLPACGGTSTYSTRQEHSRDEFNGGLGAPALGLDCTPVQSATHGTAALLPTRHFGQPQALTQLPESTMEPLGWQPAASDASKPLAPLTEGKQVALPLLDPSRTTDEQCEDGPARTPAAHVTTGEPQEQRAAWSSTAYAGVAAGVEGRVVVESREEANRRRFALISSQLRQQPSTIQVDKYNVKATILVPPDLATFKDSLLK